MCVCVGGVWGVRIIQVNSLVPDVISTTNKHSTRPFWSCLSYEEAHVPDSHYI